ncbi:hypothetical protein [Methylobacterium sp. PvR107]|uniref:hypothetical protein n=1 Tax=Methylobacterium sp. PvR107 TaxID=2806597 RepID=UPI001AE88C6C|nr:hypothetical protein [Methylobacterium sp. PvR107]MBP1180757.1 hypothetical protein [Methylobacterium sp. PvR107]
MPTNPKRAWNRDNMASTDIGTMDGDRCATRAPWSSRAWTSSSGGRDDRRARQAGDLDLTLDGGSADS